MGAIAGPLRAGPLGWKDAERGPEVHDPADAMAFPPSILEWRAPVERAPAPECQIVPAESAEEALPEEPDGDKAELAEALCRNRGLQAAIARTLADVSEARGANEAQHGQLQRRFGHRGKKRRIRPVSLFSSPAEPRVAPPKNSDAVGRALFRDRYLRPLGSKMWQKAEEQALLATLETRLREEAFQSRYEERSARMSPGERLRVFDDVLSEVRALELAELWEVQNFRVDWKCISQRLSFEGYARDAKSCFLRFTQKLDPALARGRFTKSDDKAVLQLATDYEGFHWDCIAETAGSQRSAWSTFARYQRSLNPKLMRGDWTAEEAQRLRALGRQFDLDLDCRRKGRNALCAAVARLGDGRSSLQTVGKLKSFDRGGVWSTAEDRQLELLLSVYGLDRGSDICRHFPRRTRINVLCHAQLLHWLSLGNSPWHSWGEEEDRILARFVRTEGVGNWTAAQRHLPGRQTKEISNRFNVLNPSRMADMYGILLATRHKMIPLAERRPTSELKASDFAIRLYTAGGSDITTGDPMLDRYLRKVNKRRRAQAARLAKAAQSQPPGDSAAQAERGPGPARPRKRKRRAAPRADPPPAASDGAPSADPPPAAWGSGARGLPRARRRGPSAGAP